MKNLLVATAIIAMSASSTFAQTTKPAANPDGDTPAVTTPSDQNATAPVEGAARCRCLMTRPRRSSSTDESSRASARQKSLPRRSTTSFYFQKS